MKAIATYQRVSTKEQARDTDALVRQAWQLDRQAAKYPERVRLKFEDIQSGRRDDRPDMIRLIAAIKQDKIDILIVTRIDRIGRDLESNSRLQKLLQKKQVRVFEDMLDRFLDWKNPNDWKYFTQAGLDAEGESRMLAARIGKTFQWQRSLGKMGGGMVGFPYRRNEQGFIEPDPDKWQLAIKCIQIVIEENGASMRACIRIRELGLERSRTGISKWIRSPLIRGHTPYNVRDDDGKIKPNQCDLFLNSHVSLFSDRELVGAEKIIDRIIKDSERYKGKTRRHLVHPLSGLIYCQRCGAICHVKVCTTATYVICANRNKKGIACGAPYGKPGGKREPINARYEAIEDEVILQLTQRSATLVDLALSEVQTEAPIHPDIARLEGEIIKLRLMNDPDLDSAIAKKAAQLNRLRLVDPLQNESMELRDEFIKLFANPITLIRMPDADKRELFREWIERIDVDQRHVSVKLKI